MIVGQLYHTVNGETMRFARKLTVACKAALQ